MTEPVGIVLLTEAGDRGVFVRPVEIEAFRELIALILDTPTVAGPPLIPGPLADLADKLAVPLASGAGSPTEIRLSPVDVECLTLLRHQIAIRQRLPLRIRRTCTTCGNTKIVNPNLVKKSNNGELLGTAADAAIDTMGMVADGHYIRAVIKVMGTASSIAGKTKEAGPVCEECEGQEFATPAVTYCPNCKKLRTETILLECPDCGADFVNPDERLGPWRPAELALADFRQIANIALFERYAPRFEKALYAGQKKALAEALTGDDELLCMCRCGRPGESLRAVALLLTTNQLIWARQLAAGDVTSGTIRWLAITRIGKLPPVKDHGQTLEIETADGTRLALNGFKGVGTSFHDYSNAFTAESIANLISGLASIAVTEVLPPAPLPPPVQPPVPFPATPPQYPPAPPAYPPAPPAYPSAPPAYPPLVTPAAPTAPEPVPPADAPAPTIRAVAQVPVAPPDAGQTSPPPAPPAYPPPPAAPILVPQPAVDLSALPPPQPPATPGWYDDPLHTYRFRWWDGARWTTTFHR